MALVVLVLVMQEVSVVRWSRSAESDAADDGTALHRDGARQWAPPENVPAELPLAPGDPATGQTSDYPQRAPRRLG